MYLNDHRVKSLVVTTLEELEFSYCAVGGELSFLTETLVGRKAGRTLRFCSSGEEGNLRGGWEQQRPAPPCKMRGWSQIPKVQVGSLKRHPPCCHPVQDVPESSTAKPMSVHLNSVPLEYLAVSSTAL